MKRNSCFSTALVSRFFQREWEKGLRGLSKVGRSLQLGISRHRVYHSGDLDAPHGVIDPRSKLFQQWYKVFVISCLVAIFVDPLFYYLPVVDGYQSAGGGTCIKISRKLAISLTVLRSITDTFYLIHMALQFRTAFLADSSRMFRPPELVVDPYYIATRYLKKDFWLDLAALLPLPQVLPNHKQWL
jgi:cyclic nucleotide gated channel